MLVHYTPATQGLLRKIDTVYLLNTYYKNQRCRAKSDKRREEKDKTMSGFSEDVWCNVFINSTLELSLWPIVFIDLC